MTEETLYPHEWVMQNKLSIAMATVVAMITGYIGFIVVVAVIYAPTDIETIALTQSTEYGYYPSCISYGPIILVCAISVLFFMAFGCKRVRP